MVSVKPFHCSTLEDNQPNIVMTFQLNTCERYREDKYKYWKEVLVILCQRSDSIFNIH